MNTPAVLKRNDEPLPDLPDDGSRFVVADNGVYLERRTPMFTTSTRVSRWDLGLDGHKEYCRLHCGQLSRAMHRAMLGFFRAAHQLHGGEAALVLLYHPDLRRFRWHCPDQTVRMYWWGNSWVSDDSIRFDNPLELPDGYLHFGDAHLHPGSPQPSVVDLHDDQDGLHIIVGHVMTRPAYNVEFVIDGSRFRVPPEMIFADPACEPFDRVPQTWLDRIRLDKEERKSSGFSSHGSFFDDARRESRGDDRRESRRWGGYDT